MARSTWVLCVGVTLGLMGRSVAQWSCGPTVNVPICKAVSNQDKTRDVSEAAGSSSIAWQGLRKGTMDKDTYAQRIVGSASHPVSPTPDSVVLVQPADGALVGDSAIAFVWRESTPQIDLYWFEIATDSQFVATTVDSAVADTQIVHPPLAGGTQYWWRVRAHNETGWGPFSSVRTVSTSNPATVPDQVILLHPAHNAQGVSSDVTFRWHRSRPFVDLYRLEVTTDSNYFGITIDTMLVDTSAGRLGLTYPSTYWWRVRAHNSLGWGPISAPSRFSLVEVDSPLSLFPLNVGDVWQYHEFYRNLCEPEPFSQYYFVRVTGDSLMPDGRHYKRLEGTASLLGGWSLRMDSSTACLYRYTEYPVPSQALVDSFLAMPGDTWRDKMCESVDTATVFGVHTVTKSLRRLVTPEWPLFTYASGIGLIREIEYGGEGSGCPIGWLVTRDLVYARVDGKEYGEVVGISAASAELPETFSLFQNYPNPFNPSTTIEYTLPHAGYATLRVYNVLGEEVATLVDGEQAAGTYKATWDASGTPSGVYFLRLRNADDAQTKKAVLLW
jgi:hypothetical protein